MAEAEESAARRCACALPRGEQCRPPLPLRKNLGAARALSHARARRSAQARSHGPGAGKMPVDGVLGQSAGLGIAVRDGLGGE